MKSIFANDRLRVSVTDACNFSCNYCTNEGQSHLGKNYIKLGFVQKLSDFIIENDIYVKKLNITGGEPLLHKELLEIVKMFRRGIANISLNTNGQLLNEEKIVRLHEAGLNCIKFGIDSFFKTTTKPFGEHRNCDAGNIINNLITAKKIMPRSSVNIVMTDFNFPEFEDTLNFIIDNKINYVEFLELINYDFRSSGGKLAYGLRFKEIFKKYKSYFKDITYNKKIGKYICTTHNDIVVQFADDFCMSRVCRNLWTRISSDECFIPCIKSNDRIKIDFNVLMEQINMNNCLMCNGPGNEIVRDYHGNLLQNGVKGDYLPTFPVILADNEFIFSDLDL